MRSLFVVAAALLVLVMLATEAVLGHEVPRPSRIHASVCPAPGDIVVPLTELTLPAGEPAGAASAIPVESSSSSIELALAELLAADHSIVVHHAAADMGTYLVCGDLGGSVLDSEMGRALTVGLAPVGDSTYSGLAQLVDEGDGTTGVRVYVMDLAGAHGADSITASESEGSLVGVTLGTEEAPRDIAIVMTDNLRFFPDVIVVREGETIRFLLDNPTDVTHDFTLGDMAAQMHHDEEMAASGGVHEHGHGASSGGLPGPVMIEPGASADVVATFT